LARSSTTARLQRCRCVNSIHSQTVHIQRGHGHTCTQRVNQGKRLIVLGLLGTLINYRAFAEMQVLKQHQLTHKTNSLTLDLRTPQRGNGSRNQISEIHFVSLTALAYTRYCHYRCCMVCGNRWGLGGSPCILHNSEDNEGGWPCLTRVKGALQLLSNRSK